MQKKRVGILLSGGAASGMNAAVQAFVFLLTSLEYEVIGFKAGWSGLMNNDYKILTPKSVFKIANFGGGILQSCTKVNVFDQNGQDRSIDCEKVYSDLELECIFVLGGDGSIRQANELSQKTLMQFITVPCTMDMDVVCTQETIGFHTAVNEAARVIVAMSRDGYCMGRSVVIEVMGRSSGAVATYATAAALESGIKVDFLIIPEIPHRIQNIADTLKNKKTPSVIVIAEGASTTVQLQSPSGIHQQLAGTGEKLAEDLQKLTGKTFKATGCGYCQRSGQTTDTDIFLANQFAQVAVEEFDRGNSNVSICYIDHAFVPVQLSDVAKANTNTTTSKGLSKGDKTLCRLQTISKLYFGN